jgi:hypothetical protein
MVGRVLFFLELNIRMHTKDTMSVISVCSNGVDYLIASLREELAAWSAPAGSNRWRGGRSSRLDNVQVSAISRTEWPVHASPRRQAQVTRYRTGCHDNVLVYIEEHVAMHRKRVPARK